MDRSIISKEKQNTTVINAGEPNKPASSLSEPARLHPPLQRVPAHLQSHLR